jgi:hypothetical protein
MMTTVILKWLQRKKILCKSLAELCKCGCTESNIFTLAIYKTKKMKRILLIVAFIATLSVQEGFAQDNQGQALLSSYYDIKNALVNSDAATAAAKAAEFLKLTAFKSYQDKLAFNAGIFQKVRILPISVSILLVCLLIFISWPNR